MTCLLRHLHPGVSCAQPGARARPVKTKTNLENDDLGGTVNNNESTSGNFIAVTAALYCALRRAQPSPDPMLFNSALTAAQRGRCSYQLRDMG